MKRAIVIALLLMLIGCATALPEKVYVPVHTPCVKRVPEAPESEYLKEPEPPAPEVDTQAFYEAVFNQVRSLLIDRELNKIYQADLMAVIEGCM